MDSTKFVIITGQMGCGKSTVCSDLREMGYLTCDSDIGNPAYSFSRLYKWTTNLK